VPIAHNYTPELVNDISNIIILNIFILISFFNVHIIFIPSAYQKIKMNFFKLNLISISITIFVVLFIIPAGSINVIGMNKYIDT